MSSSSRRRKCRNGDSCAYYLEGKCNFSHPDNDDSEDLKRMLKNLVLEMEKMKERMARMEAELVSLRASDSSSDSDEAIFVVSANIGYTGHSGYCSDPQPVYKTEQITILFPADPLFPKPYSRGAKEYYSNLFKKALSKRRQACGCRMDSEITSEIAVEIE